MVVMPSSQGLRQDARAQALRASTQQDIIFPWGWMKPAYLICKISPIWHPTGLLRLLELSFSVYLSCCLVALVQEDGIICKSALLVSSLKQTNPSHFLDDMEVRFQEFHPCRYAMCITSWFIYLTPTSMQYVDFSGYVSAQHNQQ